MSRDVTARRIAFVFGAAILFNLAFPDASIGGPGPWARVLDGVLIGIGLCCLAVAFYPRNRP